MAIPWLSGTSSKTQKLELWQVQDESTTKSEDPQGTSVEKPEGNSGVVRWMDIEKVTPIDISSFVFSFIFSSGHVFGHFPLFFKCRSFLSGFIPGSKGCERSSLASAVTRSNDKHC